MDFTQLQFQELLTSIAAKTPTPGGGAVASFTAAIAAALGRMVLNYSIGKKSLDAHDALHRQSLTSLQEIGHRALELAQADAQAYAALNTLWKLDKDDERRRREFPAAVRNAIAAPMAVLQCAMEILRTLHALVDKTNAMLDSDLAIAAILADAAARSAAWNIRINLPLLNDARQTAHLRAEMDASLSESNQFCHKIEKACAIRLD